MTIITVEYTIKSSWNNQFKSGEVACFWLWANCKVIRGLFYTLYRLNQLINTWTLNNVKIWIVIKNWLLRWTVSTGQRQRIIENHNVELAIWESDWACDSMNSCFAIFIATHMFASQSFTYNFYSVNFVSEIDHQNIQHCQSAYANKQIQSWTR